MPKISVIIPTYNRADYICETIDSVLNQTYKDFELIVVDDGSTDDTKKKLEKYGSKIKLIEQPNSERAVARNNGVKNSTGEYIAFLDSDDIWIEDKLEKQVKVLDENNDYILVYGQCHRIDDNSNKIKIAKRQLEGHSGEIFEKLLMRNLVVSPTPVIRREYFEKTDGFQTRYIPYEDWEFWVRFSLLGKFYYIDEPLSYYRIHPGQSVQTAAAKKIDEVTTLLLEDSYKLKDTPKTLKRKSLGIANLRFSYWYLVSGDIEKAKEKLSYSLHLYPPFLTDPRWYGLKMICTFPSLKGKGIFNIKQYH
jgi:glycosyltransferase involved in cell wall biosynthesis